MTDTGVPRRVPVSVPAAPPGAAAGSAVASTTKPGELAVRETARQLAAASISGNTQRAYAGAMRRLGEHLAGAELTDATLADYLARLFELGRSPASAAMLVAAVRFQVRVTGSDSPVGPATDRVLAGFRRAGSDRGRGQVAGVRWGQADAAAAVAANGGESIHGLRDAAILAVASDAMLRVSELAALRVGDIGAGEDNAATVTVRHSKTDQEGEGAVLFLGASTAARISAWLGAAGVSTDDTDAPLLNHETTNIDQERANLLTMRNPSEGGSMRNESRLCPACNAPEAASHCECGKVKDKVHPVCPYCASFWVPCPNCGERAVGDGRCSNSFPRGAIVLEAPSRRRRRIGYSVPSLIGKRSVRCSQRPTCSPASVPISRLLIEPLQRLSAGELCARAARIVQCATRRLRTTSTTCGRGTQDDRTRNSQNPHEQQRRRTLRAPGRGVRSHAPGGSQ